MQQKLFTLFAIFVVVSLNLPAIGQSLNQSLSPYLVNFHLHGSLSEGNASMAHHSSEGARLGYDVLWWADHMERQLSALYRNEIGFEGSLSEIFWKGEGINEFVLKGSSTGFLSVGFDSLNPASGKYYARCRAKANPGAEWMESRLSYSCTGHLDRKSLLADPEVRIQARLKEWVGDACFLIRITFSSRPDDSTTLGVSNVIEYLPEGLIAPPPPENVKRVRLPTPPFDQWRCITLRPAEDVPMFFWEEEDQSMRLIELVFSARDGGVIEVELDDFRIQLLGYTDIELFQQQERVLSERYSGSLAHHVGMEIAGPFEQEVQQYGSRDHLVALYPDRIPNLTDFITDFVSYPEEYPGSGVQIIHEQGGLAIIAHMFGPLGIEIPDSNALYLASRIIRNEAWNAEALEVGYLLRGRPLKDHLAVWDYLSANGTYITGIAPSDNHNVSPWDLYNHRWGTWLRAQGSDAPSLIEAIRAGEAFFGDPVIFDPDGDLTLEASDGSYSMGDVVPTASRSHEFRAYVRGAIIGDELVLLLNENEVARHFLDTSPVDVPFELFINPGDFVRLEVRDDFDEPYLISNPIYFIDLGSQPPPNRTP